MGKENKGEKQNFWRRIIGLFKRDNPQKLQLLLVAVVLVFGGIFTWLSLVCFLSNYKITIDGVARAGEPEVIAQEEPTVFERRLDGIIVNSSAEANIWPAAMLVENLYSVRPQAGISEAILVYESYAEAGTTRFLLFYNGGGPKIEKIGPIRSARHYFLGWVYETAALFGHAGGSPQALGNIRDYDTNDFNGIGSEAKYFWRDTSLYAPHNLFTSSEKIVFSLRDKELLDKQATFDMWQFKDGATLEDRPESANDIVVKFSSYSYEVKWQYDRTNNNYLRFNADQPHLDSNNQQQVRANNIIIQIVPPVTYLGAYGRLDMQTEGEGRAIIFRDGQTIEGKWKKPGRVLRTQYYDSEDNLIEFNRGKTWVEVIPEDKEISF
jgi:hypothetical protein